VSGRAAAVIEAECGAVLYQMNGRSRLPPASLTKIMTALIVAERADPDDVVRITVNGPELSLATDSTVMGIEPGQRLTVRDLLYGLLLRSGNDAALQLAQYAAGTVPRFVEMMNERAAELGLSDTHFTNPHGLDDPQLYTSALDIARLGGELLARPELAEIVRTRAYQPGWDGPALENMNLLLGFYPGAVGVKTGYTDLAGQTIVAAASREGRTVIVSVLGSTFDIYADAAALLDWAFEQESGCQG
jgi:D-alanyl-D-alanine carboxypeptidase